MQPRAEKVKGHRPDAQVLSISGSVLIWLGRDAVRRTVNALMPSFQRRAFVFENLSRALKNS